MTSTLGCDPELLLVSEDTGEYIPSTGLFGGTKKEPRLVDGGAVQEDNVTAEFNTTPVVLEDADGWVQSVMTVKAYVDNVAKQNNLKTVTKASAKFSRMHLMHPATRESGCDPDYNAYTGTFNEYPHLASTDVRCAGGHIHFGDKDLLKSAEDKKSFVILCDYFVGIPLALLDTDVERRKTYGKAGNYRNKPYGVEYRTPSNIWLQSDRTIHLVRELMLEAKQAYVNGEYALIDAMRKYGAKAMDERDEHTLMEMLSYAAIPCLSEELGWK